MTLSPEAPIGSSGWGDDFAEQSDSLRRAMIRAYDKHAGRSATSWVSTPIATTIPAADDR